MSNGSEACCILGICCPPEQQRAALIREFVRVSDYDPETCAKLADFLLERFAFAPKSFQTVIDDIVRLHKAHGHHE